MNKNKLNFIHIIQLFPFHLAEQPCFDDLKITTDMEGITIHCRFGVLSKESSQVHDIKWTKNDEILDLKIEKYIGGSLADSSCKVTNKVESVSNIETFGMS